MSQWYYSHNGATHGPLSDAEIEDRIAQRMVSENDPIWPDGWDKKSAAPTAAIFDFPSSRAGNAALPDWLADVELVRRIGPLQPLTTTDEIPDWLEDLRLWVGLDFYQPARPASSVEAKGSPSSPAPSREIPDWLTSWLTPEKPKTSVPIQTPWASPTPDIPVTIPVSPPPSGKPAIVTPPGQLKPPVALPVASPVPSPAARMEPAPALPVAPTAPVAPSVSPSPSVSPQTPVALVAPPPSGSAPPTRSKPSAQSPANFIVRKTRYESGFDLETGQIVDPEKFRKWKQQQAQSTPGVSNVGILELFRKARFAIESWADDAANLPCIMQADIEEIKIRPDVQAIFREYANYGAAMQEKLLHHLTFIVENRRRYFTAIEETRKKG